MEITKVDLKQISSFYHLFTISMCPLKHPKRKGKRFEELIAKFLRNLWNLNEFQLFRSPTSGVKKDYIEFGDLSFGNIDIVKSLNHIPIFELKNHNNINIERILNDGIYTKKEFNFILQLVEQYTITSLNILDKYYKLEGEIKDDFEFLINQRILELISKWNMYLFLKTNNRNPIVIKLWWIYPLGDFIKEKIIDSGYSTYLVKKLKKSQRIRILLYDVFLKTLRVNNYETDFCFTSNNELHNHNDVDIENDLEISFETCNKHFRKHYNLNLNRVSPKVLDNDGKFQIEYLVFELPFKGNKSLEKFFNHIEKECEIRLFEKECLRNIYLTNPIK